MENPYCSCKLTLPTVEQAAFAAQKLNFDAWTDGETT